MTDDNLPDFRGEHLPQTQACERCGRALSSVIKRQGGEVLCDGCSAAVEAGEVPTHWEE